MGVSVAVSPGCPAPKAPEVPGFFVLGVDGMDPDILARLMAEGRMPHFQELATNGSFHRLGTSTPPQSPVAWSNFVTGLDPGGHGIFDFVHRDPKTYMPISSATPPVDDPGTAVEVGGFYLPVDAPVPENNRSGTAFWDRLHAVGVDVEVYRIPGNYPPTPSDAKVLAGMGTVDMRGGYGVYTWYTDQPVPNKEKLKGDIQLVSASDEDLDGTPETVRGVLRGPPDFFHLAPGQLPRDADYLTASVTVTLDPEHDVALVDVGGNRTVVAEGGWSDWVPVTYDALPAGMMPLEGMVRFYAKELRPGFALYASPVNIDPNAPAQPISTPDEFSADIGALLGRYYTQGMPEETNALKDRIFDDNDYQAQVGLVESDTANMLDVALLRFKPGSMSFMYLSNIDLQCHMLWRHGDPKHPNAPVHPAYAADAAVDHADDIEGYYEHVDALLGTVQARLPAGTTLVVMSDHGFQPYRREVNLNAWLRDQGYLVLKDGKTEGHIATGDVDWSKTRAYGLGFNGLYLNLVGRESQGIVSAADAEALRAELSAKLLAFADGPDRVVLRVDRAEQVYHGARVGEAPDLVVGYDRGFGCSDESTLGEVEAAVLKDNTSRWSGNHLMAPEVVPGVLLSNQKIKGEGHELADVTATILSHFGVAAPDITGQSFLSP